MGKAGIKVRVTSNVPDLQALFEKARHQSAALAETMDQIKNFTLEIDTEVVKEEGAQ